MIDNQANQKEKDQAPSKPPEVIVIDDDSPVPSPKENTK